MESSENARTFEAERARTSALRHRHSGAPAGARRVTLARRAPPARTHALLRRRRRGRASRSACTPRSSRFASPGGWTAPLRAASWHRRRRSPTSPPTARSLMWPASAVTRPRRSAKRVRGRDSATTPACSALATCARDRRRVARTLPRGRRDSSAVRLLSSARGRRTRSLLRVLARVRRDP